MLQFKQASIVDKPAFIEIFQERCVPKILKFPDFDYSRLEDESLEGVIDTTSICGWKSSSIIKEDVGKSRKEHPEFQYILAKTVPISL